MPGYNGALESTLPVKCGINERVKNPWATVPLKGDSFAARSTSTWTPDGLG